MHPNSKLLDDLAKLASGAMGSVAGAREEVEARLRDRLERTLARMDVVTRDEFTVVEAVASNARAAQEELEGRLKALEERIAVLEQRLSGEDG